MRERKTIPHLSFASLKLVLAQKLQNLLHQDKALLAALPSERRPIPPETLDLTLRNLPK